jgi:hypothetical protein
MSEAYTITREQCEQLDREYLINDCIYYLMKSRSLVGGNKTIDEAIEELKTQTRFSDEVQEIYKKNLGSLAQDFFNSFSL